MRHALLSPRHTRLWGFVGVGLILMGAIGCVQRRIKVTSRPSGALVYLNDEEVGRTPVVVPFTFYGTYDVRLLLDGHKPLWTEREAKAPWWEFPGPDLIAEALPDGRSEVAWDFELEPVEALDEKGLIERAGEMRGLAGEDLD